MLRQPARYDFSQLPLTVSGNIPVARVSGYVVWKLRENGDQLSIAHLMELFIAGPHGALIEVDIHADPITEPIRAALKKLVESSFAEIDSTPVGNPAELPEKMRPVVDSTSPEDAEQLTD
jgi:hypothetical protein